MKKIILSSLAFLLLSGCSASGITASILDSIFPAAENTSVEIDTEKAEQLATGQLDKEEADLQKAKELEAFKQKIVDHKAQESAGKTLITISYPKSVEVFRTGDTKVALWGEVANAQNVAQIRINDFILTKYQAGDSRFSYIASKYFGTLERGENTYTIQALNADAEILTETIYTIISDAKYTQLTDSGPQALLFLSLLFAAILAFFFQKNHLNFLRR